MRVLIACEFSGIVRDAFIAKGHDALSCDLLPTEKSGPHYQGDIRDIIGEQWDMMIAFPPCTYLTFARNAHPVNEEETRKALEFVRFLMSAPIQKIAIENPRGRIQTYIRKPDQIIQPYNFGHAEQKRTCLWLKNLPPLMTTCTYLNRREFVVSTTRDRSKNRSRTFQGIALAMAQQWG